MQTIYPNLIHALVNRTVNTIRAESIIINHAIAILILSIAKFQGNARDTTIHRLTISDISVTVIVIVRVTHIPKPVFIEIILLGIFFEGAVVELIEHSIPIQILDTVHWTAFCCFIKIGLAIPITTSLPAVLRTGFTGFGQTTHTITTGTTVNRAIISPFSALT
jgi:hypothetical protein